MAAVFAAILAAGYPRAAAVNNMISGATPSTDTADLDGFGLNCRRPGGLIFMRAKIDFHQAVICLRYS
jgi:hypothetical protein